MSESKCDGCGDTYPNDMVVWGTHKQYCAYCLGFDPMNEEDMHKMWDMDEEEVDDLFWDWNL